MDEKDPIAFAWYWEHLRKNVLCHPQREEVLQAALNANFSVATTGHLAKLATEQLRRHGVDTMIDQGSLNRYLGHLTRTGGLLRVPKLSNDNHYLISPNPIVQRWLNELDFGIKGPSKYPGGVASDTVRYIGRVFAKDGLTFDDRPEYSTTPVEALVDMSCRKLGYRPTDVQVALGSQSRVEASIDVLTNPVLDLEVTLPDEDDEWGDGKRVHDYAVAFDVQGTSEPSAVLKNQLQMLLALFVGIPITGYFVDTARDREAAASNNQMNKKIQQFVRPIEKSVDAACRRIGQDVSYDESEDRVLAGLYFRDKMPSKDDEN
jgi:hypothetical protein